MHNILRQKYSEIFLEVKEISAVFWNVVVID